MLFTFLLMAIFHAQKRYKEPAPTLQKYKYKNHLSCNSICINRCSLYFWYLSARFHSNKIWQIQSWHGIVDTAQRHPDIPRLFNYIWLSLTLFKYLPQIYPDRTPQNFESRHSWLLIWFGIPSRYSIKIFNIYHW